MTDGILRQLALLTSILFFALPSAIGDAAEHAPDAFAARVALAQDAERQADFANYYTTMDRALGEQYATAMRKCVALNAGSGTEAFTLVADISANGGPTAVAVQPQTPIASCFAEGVRQIRFPLPPGYPGRSGFPITITMRIVP